MFAPPRLSFVVSALVLCCLATHSSWAQCTSEGATSFVISDGTCSNSLSPIACDDSCAGCRDDSPLAGGCGQGCGGRAGCRQRAGKCKKCCGYRSDGSYCGFPEPRYPVPFATPRPTTPTYFTYPPMMPHNSLPHFRKTYAFRHGPGLSQTQVHWRERKLWLTADFLHNLIEIPR